MKFSNYCILSLLILTFLSCAKQSTPLGGPVDEKKPEIISISPEQSSLNTRPQEIVVIFDEYIKLDNPSKNIIITPKLNKDELEITALKNSVKIKLNQNLEDNTTYVFNFQAAVKDLSEGNPATNLKLVFSTGDKIDSLSVVGKVNYLFPKETEYYQKVIVGLHLASDSTTAFQTAPYYLSQIDSSGNFQINNIKPGSYKAFAWEDDNSNLKIDYKSENFDFFLDTLNITSSTDNLFFHLSKGDQTPIKLIRSSQNGKHYDLVLNRNAADININHPDIGKTIFYSTAVDKRIKLYSTNVLQDSLAIILNIKDSVQNQTDTTIYAKFLDSDRRPEKLTISGNTGKSFYEHMPIELRFNKPILAINYDSLYISYDTASRISISPSMVHFSDSTTRTTLNIKVPIADDINFDLFTIKASDSTFLDIESVYNDKSFLGNYKKLKKETLSDAISGQIINEKPPFIVQLINSKKEVAYEQIIQNSVHYKFISIEPGTYQILVIADHNENQRWDPSNYELKKYAERTAYFKNFKTNSREVTIRGGWTLEDQNIEFGPKTGFQNQKISVDN